MELLKLDDYQSWLLRLRDGTGATKQVLIDPWLTEQVQIGGRWLFARRHRAEVVGLDALGPIDLVLISAHFPDHFHRASLRLLARDTPVWTTKKVAARTRALGFTRVEVLAYDELRVLGPGIELRTLRPAAPYEHDSLGFAFTDALGARLVFETHGVEPDAIAGLGPIDLLVAPVEEVRLLGRRIVRGVEEVADLIASHGIARFASTGNDPDRAEGLLARMLRIRGSEAELERALAERDASCRVSKLGAGERIELPGSARLRSTG